MKNYLIRRRVKLGMQDEHWLYLATIESNPGGGLPPTIKEVPDVKIVEGVRTFETFHEAVSFKGRMLNDNWEVLNVYDVLVETLKELTKARA